MPPSILDRLPIRHGNHPRREDGMCAMEMVAWLAGEPHSDEPACTCRVLAAFVRALNDLLPDARTRDRHLRPLLPRLVNTADRSGAAQNARAFVALDAAVRSFAPASLAALGRHDEADAARRLPPIVDRDGAAVAAALLGPMGPPVRAACWTAAQAAAAQPPRIWVTGAVHQAKAAGTLDEAARVLERMLGVAETAPVE